MEEIQDEKEQLHTLIKVAAVAGIGGLILIVFIVIQYMFMKRSPGTIVLPNGTTYLGPSGEQTQTPPPPTQESTAPEPQITEKEGEEWQDVKGKTYPYTFSAPESMKLVTFPNDAYDIYAIDCCNILPQSNVLIGVDNLEKNAEKKQYISSPKKVYVQEWWKQFAGLKGVGSLVEFTNSKGLKGYRAKYVNAQNQSPNEDVFFEVSGSPQYVIHLARGVMDQALFDKIIDSVGWRKPAAPTPQETTTP